MLGSGNGPRKGLFESPKRTYWKWPNPSSSFPPHRPQEPWNTSDSTPRIDDGRNDSGAYQKGAKEPSRDPPCPSGWKNEHREESSQRAGYHQQPDYESRSGQQRPEFFDLSERYRAMELACLQTINAIRGPQSQQYEYLAKLCAATAELSYVNSEIPWTLDMGLKDRLYQYERYLKVQFEQTLEMANFENYGFRKETGNRGIKETQEALNTEVQRTHRPGDDPHLACKSHLQSLHEFIDAREAEFDKLRQENATLTENFNRVQQEVRKERIGQCGSYEDTLLNPSFVEKKAKDTIASINTFCKSFSAYKSPDGKVPAKLRVEESIFRDLCTVGKNSWTLMLKAYVSDVLFYNFESEKFQLKGSFSTMFLNPEDRVRECAAYVHFFENDANVNQHDESHDAHRFDSLFDDYYFTRSQHILPQEVRDRFHTRDCVLLAVGHHNTGSTTEDASITKVTRTLAQKFYNAARNVWRFHKICLAFDPPATIFRVAPNDDFDRLFMIPNSTNDGNVTHTECDDSETDDSDSDRNRTVLPKISAMIYPGFRLRKSLVKCEVYFGVQS